MKTGHSSTFIPGVVNHYVVRVMAKVFPKKANSDDKAVTVKWEGDNNDENKRIRLFKVGVVHSLQGMQTGVTHEDDDQGPVPHQFPAKPIDLKTRATYTLGQVSDKKDNAAHSCGWGVFAISGSEYTNPIVGKVKFKPYLVVEPAKLSGKGKTTSVGFYDDITPVVVTVLSIAVSVVSVPAAAAGSVAALALIDTQSGAGGGTTVSMSCSASTFLSVVKPADSAKTKSLSVEQFDVPFSAGDYSSLDQDKTFALTIGDVVVGVLSHETRVRTTLGSFWTLPGASAEASVSGLSPSGYAGIGGSPAFTEQ